MTVKPGISNELRTMVREVLRDVMANRADAGSSAVETIRIDNDNELATFVARVIEPVMLERVRSGKLRFTLGSRAAAQNASLAGQALTGVITEQKIDKLASAGRLILAPGAVLTPLARDRARKLGLKIERNT